MKQRIIFNTVSGVILVLMLVSCASQAPVSVPLEEKLAQQGFTLGEQVNKVINFQVSGWNNVDRKHVIMNFGASRNYLVTLRTSCNSLLGATVISFSTTVGMLTDNDKLLVRDSSQHIAQCYISTIHELEKIKKTG
ncbi:MAG: DUF6491 family protein [Lysobacterales bacterium]